MAQWKEQGVEQEGVNHLSRCSRYMKGETHGSTGAVRVIQAGAETVAAAAAAASTPKHYAGAFLGLRAWT